MTIFNPQQTQQNLNRQNRQNRVIQLRRGLWQKRTGFGLNEVIGMAAALMIAAVVVVPGLKSFASDAMIELTTWWQQVSSDIFQTV
jgi:hypothetical protein